MKLAGQTVTVVLSEEGRAVLGLADIVVPDFPLLAAFIEETEDLGLWIRIPGLHRVRLFLLRWEFILAIDFETGKVRLIGLRS